MRIFVRPGVPTSKTNVFAPVSAFDTACIFISPFLAVALRDPELLRVGDFSDFFSPPYIFAYTSIACALLCVALFRLSEGMTRYFSAHDAVATAGATIAATALTSSILFVLTRLEGVPRSTPLLYAAVLGGSLMLGRALAGLRGSAAVGVRSERHVHVRQVLLVGVDHFSVAAIKLTECQSPRTTQIVALLEMKQKLRGRTVSGAKVVGGPDEIETVVQEYAVHGIFIDEVWLSDSATTWPEAVLKRLRSRCEARSIPCVTLSDALNLRMAPDESHGLPLSVQDSVQILDGYFTFKRIVDVVIASALLVVLLPPMLLVAFIVYLDVGAPVLFWQQRIGRGGRKFTLHKFRTYRAPFDARNAPVEESRRMSRIGKLIRSARLDEGPQLLNVLFGDMSLIGPRPLLPVDQPLDPRVRLLVRPGITGWAQVHGGTLLSAEEKDSLDRWYIQNASLAVDMKIIYRTVMVALRGGERKDHGTVDKAMSWRTSVAKRDTHLIDGVSDAA